MNRAEGHPTRATSRDGYTPVFIGPSHPSSVVVVVYNYIDIPN